LTFFPRVTKTEDAAIFDLISGQRIFTTPAKMSTAAELPAPVRVSPLIKFGRWSLLTVGILYGLSRHRSLAKKETVFREMEAKKKAELAPKLAAEKARLAKQELDDLARAAGVTPV